MVRCRWPVRRSSSCNLSEAFPVLAAFACVASEWVLRLRVQASVDVLQASRSHPRLAEPAFNHRRSILASIPGIGETTAIALLVEMPELGRLEPGPAAGLAGFARMARDSGKTNGGRFIRGGRAGLRRALYLPARAATRFNPEFSS